MIKLIKMNYFISFQEIIKSQLERKKPAGTQNTRLKLKKKYAFYMPESIETFLYLQLYKINILT